MQYIHVCVCTWTALPRDRVWKINWPAETIPQSGVRQGVRSGRSGGRMMRFRYRVTRSLLSLSRWHLCLTPAHTFTSFKCNIRRTRSNTKTHARKRMNPTRLRCVHGCASATLSSLSLARILCAYICIYVFMLCMHSGGLFDLA